MRQRRDAMHPTVPSAFPQHNQAQFRRTVALTEQALARLQAAGQPVTLARLAEATRVLDERGKGLTAVTILRNPQARELFHQHSPVYQQRQQRAQQVSRQHSGPRLAADARAAYRGLRAAELIQMIEDLKQALAGARTQQAKLQVERDEACRVRDEALRQNARQLAALTKSQAPLSAAAQTRTEPG
jgi:hypothetical protein